MEKNCISDDSAVSNEGEQLMGHASTRDAECENQARNGSR